MNEILQLVHLYYPWIEAHIEVNDVMPFMEIIFIPTSLFLLSSHRERKSCFTRIS